MQREFTARGIPFIRARRDFPREKLGFSVLSARSVAGRAKIKASSQFPCGEFPLLLAAYCAISLSLFEPARILEFVSWLPLERVSSREGKMGGERIDFLFFFRVSRMQRIIGREEGKGNAPTSATTLCFRSCPPLATCRPPNNASFYGYLPIQFDSNEARARSIFQLIGSRCLDISYSRKRFYPIFSCILKVYLVLCERDITRRGKNISRLPLVKIESNSRVNFEKRVNGKSK